MVPLRFIHEQSDRAGRLLLQANTHNAPCKSLHLPRRHSQQTILTHLHAQKCFEGMYRQ